MGPGKAGSIPTKATRPTTGIRVNADSAMRLTAVYSAVRILAETVATLPLLVYRRTENDGKERAKDYFLYPLLHDQPNEEQTSVEFREMLQAILPCAEAPMPKSTERWGDRHASSPFIPTASRSGAKRESPSTR
jgi:hypothetical protein